MTPRIIPIAGRGEIVFLGGAGHRSQPCGTAVAKAIRLPPPNWSAAPARSRSMCECHRLATAPAATRRRNYREEPRTHRPNHVEEVNNFDQEYRTPPSNLATSPVSWSDRKKRSSLTGVGAQATPGSICPKKANSVIPPRVWPPAQTARPPTSRSPWRAGVLRLRESHETRLPSRRPR